MVYSDEWRAYNQVGREPLIPVTALAVLCEPGNRCPHTNDRNIYKLTFCYCEMHLPRVNVSRVTATESCLIHCSLISSINQLIAFDLIDWQIHRLHRVNRGKDLLLPEELMIWSMIADRLSECAGFVTVNYEMLPTGMPLKQNKDLIKYWKMLNCWKRLNNATLNLRSWQN